MVRRKHMFSFKKSNGIKNKDTRLEEARTVENEGIERNEVVENSVANLDQLKKINSLLKYVTEMDYIKDMLLGVNKQSQMIENVASSSEEMTASIEEISSFV
jgi:methyl-accepting chemotaxis protein